MSQLSTFTSVLQIVNYVLPQLNCETIPSLAVGTGTDLQQYVSMHLKAFVNQAFSCHDWKFATSEPYALEFVRTEDPAVYRTRSVWKIPTSAGSYLRVVKVFLKRGLRVYDEVTFTGPDNPLRWRIDVEHQIHTPFDVTNYEDRTNLMYATLLQGSDEPATDDISTWPVYFCLFFANCLKQTLAMTEGGQVNLSNNYLKIEPYALEQAVEEDDRLSNEEWHFAR